MAILYKTGVECIGKIRGYFVFCNTIHKRYGVVKDTGGDIYPPHCAYALETALRLKDISPSEIAAFASKLAKES